MNINEAQESFKIITIGNSGVGKTSLLKRFVFDTFSDKVFSTLGLEYTTKEITLKNGKKIILKLFDTAGQEKYRSLSKSYFRNVDGVLFVYAVNDLKSFENIKDWIKIFNVNNEGKKDIPIYLVENKNDLEKKVSEPLILDFLNKYEFKFKSVSSKLNKRNSINELFQEISEILYKNFKNPKLNQNYKLELVKYQKIKRKRTFCFNDK